MIHLQQVYSLCSFGKGTKLSKYLINHDKIYEAEIKLGIKTDTADREGKVLEEKEVDKKCLNKLKIEKLLKNIIGKQEQIPPMYSAIKVNGKKLYEYARKGEKIEIQARKIEIYDLKLNYIKPEENIIGITAFVSKGTYIRTLCESIAEALNTVGYMNKLNRISVGEFKIEDAITINELENKKDNKDFLENNLITIEEIFKEEDKLVIDDERIEKFKNGMMMNCSLKDGIYRIYNEQKEFIGIGKVKDKKIKRDIVV